MLKVNVVHVIKFQKKSIFHPLISCYSIQSEPKEPSRSYKDTVLLPKTKFPRFVEVIKKRDKWINKEAKFEEFYEWQREHMKGDEFVLHDGPPYANGVPHMGHAINKILKDIILRSRLIQGMKVHFIPGWDCHGLPIELIALQKFKSKLGKEEYQSLSTQQEIRQKSRKVAARHIKEQENDFKIWGVLGDWDKHYRTMSSDYMKNELQIFWKLYEKGYVFHGLKPVYWSPSSRTALADSELEYNPQHKSLSVTVRFQLEDNHNTNSNDGPTYLLVWTTTPWTLTANAAVCFSTKLEYSLVKIESLLGSYILASKLIETNQKKMNKEITVLRPVSHDELSNLKYIHPWWKDRVMGLLDSSEVEEIATGLLHCAPAHGHTDFLLGLKHNLPLECYVDSEGCFTKKAGLDLKGLSVLDEGSRKVVDKLGSDIVMEETFVHSYPYDWRTHEPVIIVANKQWFIDTEKLKTKAIESLENVPIPMEYFKTNLESRPFWCLSRQRVWGVPIPVFFDKKTNKLLISKDLVDHICDLIMKSGTDSWWRLPLEELFPVRFCEEFNVKLEDVEKGKDIMDVWFDSGVSWSYALDGKTADVCLEGVDQFRGWFQSLLLTSVAVNGKAPYKRLLVHGVAVDEEGKKMSKSKGNVFSPDFVVKGQNPLGVDTLRWWVASHGLQGKVSVSNELLESDFQETRKFRQMAAFLLGVLDGVTTDDIQKLSLLYYLDRYMLNMSYEFYHSMMNHYNNYDINLVTRLLLRFVSEVSALYVTVIKDRLYCDEINSNRRKSALCAAAGILETLCYCLAPVLPHLVEEIHHYRPIHGEKLFFYNDKMWKPPSTWENKSLSEIIDPAFNIKKELSALSVQNPKVCCVIETGEEEYRLLKELNGGVDESSDSQLTEILETASVTLRIGERKVSANVTEKYRCARCRRYSAVVENSLCLRCEDILSKSIV